MSTKHEENAAVSDECLQCGEPLRAGARFCSACGAPAGTTEPPSAEAAPPAFPAFPQGIGAAMGTMTGGGLGAQPGFSTQQRTLERVDMVAIVAKWYGALRQVVVDKDPAGFSGTVREILDMIAPFTVERDQFQNFMFECLRGMAQQQVLLPSANAAISFFPERFKPFIDDPSRFSLGDMEGGPWPEIITSWPYGTFVETWNIPDDQLSEICAQTVYEGSGPLNPPNNGYLEDEQARIDGGLYPNSIRPIVQRALAKGYAVDTKEWGDTAEQRADAWIKLFAPFAHPGFYRQLQAQMAPYGGVPVPFEKLSDWELEQIHAFVKDQDYNRQEVLNMLVNRWEALSTQLSTALHRSQMGEAFQSMFALHHFLLTHTLNINSRRTNPQHHKDYGSFVTGTHLESALRQQFEENMPIAVRSLWPSQGSLFTLEYMVNQQRATQAAQSAPATPPPPPPGRGPGKVSPDGEVHYPMLPEIPLTPEGAGVRKDGVSLVLELVACELDEAPELKQVESKLRELVSNNLTAFGLTEKRYKEMDDVTLVQYLLDITA